MRQPVDCADGDRTVVAQGVLPKGSATAVSAISVDLNAPAAVAQPTSPDLVDAGQAATIMAAIVIDGDVSTAPADAIAPEEAARSATLTAFKRVRPSASPRLPLDNRTWTLLTRTNDAINRAIIQRTDIDIYGVDEMWATPLEDGGRYGDCEDYVLEKRRALIAAGVPTSALSIAVARTGHGDIHAVLLVSTDKGDYVLDNLNAWVLPWAKTGYTWLERQVDGAPWNWALSANRPVTAPANLLLASAR